MIMKYLRSLTIAAPLNFTSNSAQGKGGGMYILQGPADWTNDVSIVLGYFSANTGSQCMLKKQKT